MIRLLLVLGVIFNTTSFVLAALCKQNALAMLSAGFVCICSTLLLEEPKKEEENDRD